MKDKLEHAGGNGYAVGSFEVVNDRFCIDYEVTEQPPVFKAAE